MIVERRALRGALMRATLHLVTARDYLARRPLMDPVMERCLNGNFARSLSGLDPEAIADRSQIIGAGQFYPSQACSWARCSSTASWQGGGGSCANEARPR